MKVIVKATLYKILGIKIYLRFLYRTLAFALDAGLLKKNKTFYLHHFSQKIISKGDYVLDIGANLGYYTRLFLKATGKKGKVYAVEPVKPFYENISYFLGKNHNLTLYNCALGEKNANIQLSVPNRYGYLRTGLPSVHDDTKTEVDNVALFNAKMVKGSELFQEIEYLDYVKIDVEGYEKIIITEIKEFLAKTLPCIQIEIIKVNLQLINDVLLSLGYENYYFKDNRLTVKAPDNYSQDYFYIHPTKKEKYQHIMSYS